MTRALVVDDSHFMRTVISDILEEGGIDVVDQAQNGKQAVAKVAEHEPDVVTMDVEMPEMNGIDAVREIMDRIPTPVLMLSALTTEGADATMQALSNGAVDAFAKPGGTISTELSGSREELVAAVQSVAAANPQAVRTPAQRDDTTATSTTTPDEFIEHPTLIIGASTGGPNVVESVLASLPRNAGFRVLVVQHMPEGFTSRFAARLDASSEYDIREAHDGARIGTGEGLVAAGDYHMRVSAYSNGRLRVRLDQGERQHSVRPAIDATMESAAELVDDHVTAAVFTGMGADGAEGVRAIKAAGGHVIAQDESTCAVFGIPARAIETGCVDDVLPAEELAAGIIDSVRRGS